MHRRDLLQGLAAVSGGLVLGARLPAHAAKLAHAGINAPQAGQPLTAWIRIARDNSITIISSQAELGQGVSTTLPAIIADELGADWSNVFVRAAAFDKAYRNPRANWMFTGNSESVQSFFDLMRTTGAAAREMLIAAAAERWQVPSSECRTESGFVFHALTRRRISFGELVDAAANLPVPREPKLRLASELMLVGRSLARVDVPAKVDGTAVFGIDVTLPNMLCAAVRTSPIVGGMLKSFDEPALLAEKGIRKVVRLADGIAVVADRWHQAQRALRKFSPIFQEPTNDPVDSKSIMALYRRALENGPWSTVVNEADALNALSADTAAIEATYENPFASHAPMEPMNCTAHVTDSSCEIWAPTQGQELAHVALKSALKLDDAQVVVRRTEAIGGGFGRRLLPDFVVQAALIAKAVGQPVKVIWDREEDLRRDYYRPATLVRLKANPLATTETRALAVQVVSPTILLPVFPPVRKVIDEKGFDPSAMEGMLEMPYAFANRRVNFHLLNVPVPTSVMRGTGYGPNIFALESFIDELAQAAKADPLTYRQTLLAGNSRALAVLDRAAKIGGWGKPMPSGHGRGLAFAHAFGTLIAQIAEVEVKDKAVKIRRMLSVVDCGDVLDPGIARAGIEGGVVFGLAYCKAEITFNRGRVIQDNLDSYELPYLSETPRLEVEFIRGGGPLGGVGEVSPVTVPPALANAIFAASGKRLRSMPLSHHGLHLA